MEALDLVSDNSCRLAITSPPYNIGKEYEREFRMSREDYSIWAESIIQKLSNKVSDDGHVCWQTGNHIKDSEIFPLDYLFFGIFHDLGFKLRNRIVWHFNFGLNAKKRFSGRYETLLWFTKNDEYYFNLEPVLVPQLYPGKRHSTRHKTKAGEPSGNPKGKNPSDFWVFRPNEELLDSSIWDIPNVKANHPEKVKHPCQFPTELVERCVLSLTEPGDTVLDPFIGTGTTAIAASKHSRNSFGVDRSSTYIDLASSRLRAAIEGRLQTRPLGKPVRRPKVNETVSQTPVEWQAAAE